MSTTDTDSLGAESSRETLVTRIPDFTEVRIGDLRAILRMKQNSVLEEVVTQAAKQESESVITAKFNASVS